MKTFLKTNNLNSSIIFHISSLNCLGVQNASRIDFPVDVRGFKLGHIAILNMLDTCAFYFWHFSGYSPCKKCENLVMWPQLHRAYYLNIFNRGILRYSEKEQVTWHFHHTNILLPLRMHNLQSSFYHDLFSAIIFYRI